MSAGEEVNLFRRIENRAQPTGGREIHLDCTASERLRMLERENARLADALRRLLARYADRGEEMRRLRAVDALRSRFLRNLSHEFRSLLNSVVGLTTLQLRRSEAALSAAQDESVQLIRKAADTMLDLVNDLAEEKTEGGKLELRLAHCDAEEILSTLQGMLPAPLIKAGVALIFEPPIAVPPLYSDAGKVSQILRNLINNSLKFTSNGEVRVSASYDRVSDVTIFSVRDTGVGIRPPDQRKIFEISHQPASGNGLGLPLCRTLAALLGGRLMVQSEPGAGSTFRLALPQRYTPEGVYHRPIVFSPTDLSGVHDCL